MSLKQHKLKQRNLINLSTLWEAKHMKDKQKRKKRKHYYYKTYFFFHLESSPYLIPIYIFIKKSKKKNESGQLSKKDQRWAHSPPPP